MDYTRRQMHSQFEHVPELLVTEAGDVKWAYLFDSVDFKVMLLLCATSRALNNGFLTPTQHKKLAESARLRHMTDDEFALCAAKVN